MDVAMALATLFFVLLLLSSAAISLLLFRLCVAALCPTTTPSPYSAAAGADPEAPPTLIPPRQELQEMVFLPAPKPTKAPMAAEPRRLAWREVEALTGGFDEAAMVGRGGSGNAVYLARQRVDGSAAAVKVHRWCGGGERRLAAFRRELDLLRRIGRHPRLVALLAYSDDHERVLPHYSKSLLCRRGSRPRSTADTNTAAGAARGGFPASTEAGEDTDGGGAAEAGVAGGGPHCRVLLASSAVAGAWSCT